VGHGAAAWAGGLGRRLQPRLGRRLGGGGGGLLLAMMVAI